MALLAATPLTRRVPFRDGTRCVTSRVLREQLRLEEAPLAHESSARRRARFSP